jgi:probable rRNA maturation factor
LEGLGCSPQTSLSISIVSAEEMAELNGKFRGKHEPTNVLSFCQREGAEGAPNRDMLGDVVICADRTVDDALALGYTDEEMATYLLIHGVLHLMGHDHDAPDAADDMQARVDAIFESLCG